MLEKYYLRLRRMPSISDTFYMYGMAVRYYVVLALRWAVHRHAQAIIVNYIITIVWPFLQFEETRVESNTCPQYRACVVFHDSHHDREQETREIHCCVLVTRG
eukprot:COSAG02_NODE_1351_length_13108_cov_7.661465_14_plen_103_part_00